MNGLWRLRRWLRTSIWFRRAMIAALFAAVLIFGLWLLPLPLVSGDGLTRAEELQAESSFRTVLIQAIAGIGLAGGLLFTARTYGLARSGQVTDRYAKATEQLGHESEDVRIGGLHALGQIMKDYPDYQPIVVAVLAAFIRGHTAPRAHVEDTAAAATEEELATMKGPEDDIQTALNILARRPYHSGEEAINLSYSVLVGHDLFMMDLSHARLFGTDLTSAGLVETKFFAATMEGARLHGAAMSWADLRSATMYPGALSAEQLEDADGVDEIRWCDANRMPLSATGEPLIDEKGRRVDWDGWPIDEKGMPLYDA
jgi:hypothetical protein